MRQNVYMLIVTISFATMSLMMILGTNRIIKVEQGGSLLVGWEYWVGALISGSTAAYFMRKVENV